MFVCGTPGGGKTTAVLAMLIQLFDRAIPFVVIEAAKTEYRLVKTLRNCGDPVVEALAESLQIHTPGVERLAPMRFNPLWRPAGVDLDEHIDQLLRCFKASMPLFDPLPAILAEAIEAVYEKHPAYDRPPTIDELIQAARQILANKGYSQAVQSDFRAALEVRLGTLTRRTVGRSLRSKECIPDIAQVIESYSIVELDPLESEVKCLFTLFLLTAIQQHIRKHPRTDDTPSAYPRLVIVIEEAHNIVGRSTDTQAGENHTDTKACATELICRMLAEFRALGVGLILVDQFPSLMAPQVIKSTGTKLAFRQVDREDRETLADTMLFGGLEYEEIARLLPGQAFLFSEGYHRAHRVRTPNIAKLLNLPQSPETDRLLGLVGDQRWFREGAIRRAADVLSRSLSALDHYREQKDQANRQVKGLLRQWPALNRITNAATRLEACRNLAAKLRGVDGRISAAFMRLKRGTHSEVQALIVPPGRRGKQLEELRQSQLHEFGRVLEPDTNRLREFIDRRVARLTRGVSQKED